MSHEVGSKAPEKQLAGRIQPMEVFLLAVGVAVLVHGVINQLEVNIFFGVVIIPGVFLLHKVRRKDWTKHWQEMEAEQKAREAHAKKIAEAKTSGER
jgi:uncharacterized membrane protein